MYKGKKRRTANYRLGRAATIICVIVIFLRPLHALEEKGGNLIVILALFLFLGSRAIEVGGRDVSVW